jgi:hypothetical protein
MSLRNYATVSSRNMVLLEVESTYFVLEMTGMSVEERC